MALFNSNAEMMAAVLKSQKENSVQGKAEASFDTGVSKGQALYDSNVNQSSLNNLLDQRSSAKKEIAATRRDATRGLDARENAAQRASYEAQIKRAGAGARKQTAASIAASGLQGGVANSQRRAVETDIAQQRVTAARDTMLANVALKQQNLNAYENTINSQESEARNNLLNRLNVGLAGGQQNAQMYAGIQNMITAQQTAKDNAKDGLLGGGIIPGLL